MKTKQCTIGIYGGWHLTVGLNRDLGLWMPARGVSVLAGFAINKRQRIDGGTAVDTYSIGVLFVNVSVSKIYMRA